jgi:hypothetical protein
MDAIAVQEGAEISANTGEERLNTGRIVKVRRRSMRT